MEAGEIVKRLEAGPEARQLRLIEARPGPDFETAPAVIRNLATLIYPGYDLGVMARAEADRRWLPLGCLALGRVEEVHGEVFPAVAPGAGSDAPPLRLLASGDLILWNGPHASRATLDPVSHLWAPVDRPDPRLLPAGIGAEAQAGLESAVKRLGRFPSHALVFGQGLLGHLGAQWLRVGGASVTVVDNSPKRLEFSRKSGLKQRVDLHNFDWRERIERHNPEGVELLVDATGAVGTLEGFLPHLRPGGVLCLLGAWRTQPLTSAFADAPGPDRILPPAPSFGGVPRHATLLPKWIELLSSGAVPTERLITHEVDHVEALLAMKRYCAGIRSWFGTVIHWAPPVD